MARKNDMDDFTRGRKIGKLEEGHTVTSVAVSSESTKVSFRALGKCSKPQVMLLEKLAVAVRGRKLQGMTDILSCRRKKADSRGLINRRPGRRLPLKVGHRRHRLQCCREIKNWTTDQWSRLFTDESWFSTRRNSQRILIWKEIGTGFYPSNLKERHRYGGSGVLIWGGIMLNRRAEFHIFDRGSVTGDRYYDEVLLLHVRLFRGAIGPDFIFMEGSARPHRTLAVKELLESEDITRMVWPAYSPDLNPIEHVWNTLGRRIVACLHHPENTQQLKQMVIEESSILPQEILHQLVLSMPRWCETTIAVRGGHIPY
ncbi:transposable element Tcb2 transposase [Trichonephila clavipes]|nr:transposable element Tcb2 transposase [Trichonephila clavipes]